MSKLFAFSLLAAGLTFPCLGNPFYVGSDTACFFDSSESTCTLSSGQTGIGSNLLGNPILLYTPDSGFSASATGGSVELGNFFVTPSLLGAEGGTFDVNVSFTEPGGGGQIYTAKTLGLVVFGVLGAEVTFQNPVTQIFNYPGGSFDVTLPDTAILIGAGDTVALDATITPVPEPSSMATGVVGLMFLACVWYRRREARIR